MNVSGRPNLTGDASRSRSQWFPNLLSGFRIVASPGLVILAYFEQTLWMACLAFLLIVTEWLDGFLARRLHVESATGARLDTIGDAAFYASLMGAVTVLSPALILAEAPWIVVAIGSYLVSWLASWMKFQRLPSYHTWAAKGAWLVVGAGIVCLLAELNAWPFRAAMIFVVLVNLEAVLITLVLAQCRVNVPSLWTALRDRNRSTPSPSDG